MRRALLFCAAITFAIACTDNITEPMPDRSGTTAVTPTVAFATTTTEDGLSISTDKDDYQPGDVVHLTGIGWQPGDVLDIVLTDDPLTHDPHTWTVQVGPDGTFQDDTYVVDEGDLDVKFTLIATSRATGRSLTVQFTDANIANNGVVLSPGSVTVTAGNTAAYNVDVTFGGSGDACTAGLSVTGGLPSGAVATFNPTSLTGIKDDTKRSALTITTTGVTAGTRTITVTATKGNGCDGNDRSGTAVLVVQGPAAAATNLSVSSAVGIEDGTASLSATLTSGGSAVPSKSVSFTLNGSAVGSATTNTSGVATVAGVSLGGIAVGTYSTAIGASFAGATGLTASSGTGSLTVTSKIPLTGSFTASNKPYDGNTTATITGRSLAGVVGSDDVNLTGGTATFDTKNVGTGKIVTGAGFTLSGSDAGKYVLASVLTTTANITAISLTGHFTAGNKVYDGNRTAYITGRTLGGVIGTEDVTLSGGTATFADKAVGNEKTVTGTDFTLDGAAAGNYVLASTTLTTKANITKRDLIVSATGHNKVYDRTTSATVTLSDDRVSGDAFTASYAAAAFDNKNVGTGKQVSVNGITISGIDAGNYALTNEEASTTANITAKPLTATITVQDKVYDGTTSATILGRDLTGVISPDEVTVSDGTAQFSDKNVGTDKAVSATGLSLGGADAGNYSFSGTGTGTGNITRRDLVVTATGINKVYNAKTDATVNLADDRVAGDVLSIAYTASFNDKNAGINKPVTVAGIAISGTDAGNYNLTNTSASTTANITQAPLVVSATGVNKFYDGTATATVTLSATFLETDVVSLSYANATFASPTVGLNKIVTVTGITSGGTDGANYSPNTSATTTANITYFTGAGHQFLQPVNPNLTTGNRSTFKIGSTIPVKFQIFLANGTTPVSIVVATISYVKMDNSVENTVNEDVIMGAADAGNSFRYDPTAQQYIFNLSTKNWTAGTWQLKATLDDGSTITALVDGRNK